MTFWFLPVAAFLIFWGTGIYLQALGPGLAMRTRLLFYVVALGLASSGYYLLFEMR